MMENWLYSLLITVATLVTIHYYVLGFIGVYIYIYIYIYISNGFTGRTSQ
jgi:hypothetical protein